MCVRHLAFVLLIWFPAVLHGKSIQSCHLQSFLSAANKALHYFAFVLTVSAQKAEPCPAPQLDHGYLGLKKETYPHEEELRYACDEGYKPAAEGWWATSTCDNGQWSPKPQCIDETSCLPPTIPNGHYIKNPNGWYSEHRGITIKCDDGYELSGQSDRIRCISGTWPSLPVCEKSPNACDEPPQIPHAVIIKQGYQEVFGENSKVVYECESGHTTDGAATETSVLCSSGNWTGIPSCHVFCLIDPAKYTREYFEVTEREYLREGAKKNFRCPYYPGQYSGFKCISGRTAYTSCCYEDDLNHGRCQYYF
ncbi:complement factor H-like [Acanthochromis polyacanthus]|uniref:complement factor H-like n=1 Tax=Acanthochromis polyacanthus TaxID=80966 RepID=UPI0022341B9D|nr:complement factor H-like [Acanthochromis polyacanthus]